MQTRQVENGVDVEKGLVLWLNVEAILVLARSAHARQAVTLDDVLAILDGRSSVEHVLLVHLGRTVEDIKPHGTIDRRTPHQPPHKGPRAGQPCA